MEYGHTFELYWLDGSMTRVMVKATNNALAIVALYKQMRLEKRPFIYKKIGV